jgi:hypothetical protein
MTRAIRLRRLLACVALALLVFVSGSFANGETVGDDVTAEHAQPSSTSQPTRAPLNDKRAEGSPVVTNARLQPSAVLKQVHAQRQVRVQHAPVASGKRRRPACSSARTRARQTSAKSCAAKAPKRCVSGECLPVRALSGWKQVFTDDFSNSVPLGGFSGCDSNRRSCSGLPAAVRAKWFAYPDRAKDSAGTGTYMPSRVMSIKNGLMNLHLHSENGSRLVSAPVPIIPGAVGSEGGLLYGRYAIRFRADRLVGYKTSFLLWPDSEVWPGDGEIDFPEADLAGTRWSTMYGFVHHQGATSGSDQDWHGSGVPYGVWHTAVIEWLPSRVSFLLDGRKIGSSTSRLPNTPMHWVLQTPTTDSILASLSTSGDVQIDWVAVWKPA